MLGKLCRQAVGTTLLCAHQATLETELHKSRLTWAFDWREVNEYHDYVLSELAYHVRFAGPDD